MLMAVFERFGAGWYVAAATAQRHRRRGTGAERFGIEQRDRGTGAETVLA